MARGAASRQPEANAAFVVLLYFDGVYRGMAGPLAAEDDAQAWAHEVVGDEPGWTWAVEPLVHPDALPTAQERGRHPRPQLRLLR